MAIAGWLGLTMAGAFSADAGETRTPAAARKNGTRYLTGCRQPTAKEQAALDKIVIKMDGVKRPFSGPVAPLPSTVKNYLYLPTIRAQALNNCGAYAPSYYYKTHQEARERGWERPDVTSNPERVMSPGFTYPLTNNGVDDGAVPSLVMAAICRYGIATWQDMPESPANYLAYPTAEVWRRAIPFRGDRVIEFDASTTAGIEALKAHLAGGDLAIANCKLYFDVHYPYGETASGTGWDNYVIYGNGSSPYRGHTFTLIGYDNTRTYNDGTGVKSGAFLAVNSWGQSWGAYDADIGTAGCVWFGYEYFRSLRGETRAWAMTDRIAYAPLDLAVYYLQHERMPELAMNLLAGDPSAPGARLEAFPNHGGLRPFAGWMVVDATDLNAPSGASFWLEAEDAYVLGLVVATGRVTSFTVERPAGAVIGAVDVPKETVDDGVIYIQAGPLLRESAAFGELSQVQCPGIGVNAQALADYDLDGDLDVVVAALDGTTAVVRLYENDGMGLFTDSGTRFPNLAGPALAWGDYDRDGDPDLVMCGYDGATRRTILYRNVGPGRLVDSGAVLPGLCWGASLAWGDYDNDGDLDLAISGTGDSGPHTAILRNDGGAFVDSGVSLPQQFYVQFHWVDINNDGWLDFSLGQVAYRNNGDGSFTPVVALYGDMRSAYAWGDYDGDGRMDAAVCAISHEYATTIVTRLYHNDGDFSFTDAHAGLPGAYDGSAAWGDFNNDGLLDLAYCGAACDDGSAKIAAVFQQAPGGVFRNIGAGLPGLSEGQILWGDVDNDGDLDLLASGSEAYNLGDPAVRDVALWRNVVADSPGGARPNTPPLPPATLTAEPEAEDHAVTLTWAPGSDAESSSGSLYYDVRVGRTPGGSEIVSPVAVSPFLGAHPRPMVGPQQPGRLLRNLRPGTYTWSVRAIDSGLRASEWSAERTFDATPAGYLFGDLNGDARLNIADVIVLLRMIQELTAPDLWKADFDDNGRLTNNDATYVKAALLGLPSPAAAVTKTIDGAGGVIAAYGLDMTVPPGAFPDGPTTLSLSRSEEDQPFGPDAADAAYYLRGLPVNSVLPLHLRIRDPRPPGDDAPLIAIGQSGVAHSAPESRHCGILVLKGTPDGKGYLTCDIPALDPVTTSAAPAGAVKAGPDDYYYGIDIWALRSWELYEGGHFRISFPRALHGADIENLATYLEEAYTKIQAAPLNFSYARRTRWPMEVCVTPGGGEEGQSAECSSTWGDNYASIEISETVVRNSAMARYTAAHEFFHMVQGLYDPRNRVSKALISSYHYWFDEATATWIEDLFVADPATHLPTVYNSYKYLPWNGIYWGLYGDKSLSLSQRRYGYGMAAFGRYLVKHHTQSVFASIYERIRTGAATAPSCIGALTGELGDPMTAYWLSEFYSEMLQGQQYSSFTGGGVFSELATGRTFTIKSEKERLITAKDSIPDLSGRFYMINLSFPGMGDNDALQMKLTGGARFELNALRWKSGQPAEFLGAGDYGDDDSRFTVSDLKQQQTEKWRIFALVTNNEHLLPYERREPYTLEFGVTRDGDFPLKSATVWNANLGPQFPVFNTTAAFSGQDVGGITDDMSQWNTGDPVQDVDAWVWGRRPLSVTLTYQAAVKSGTCQVDDPYTGHYVIYTVTGVKKYKVEKKVPPSQTVIETQENTTGVFDLALAKGEDLAAFGVKIVYDAKQDEYNESGVLLSSQTATDLTCNSMVFWFIGK